MYKKYLIKFLSLLSIAVWIAVFSVNQKLQVIACDVGQGDSILIQRGTTQILIDGGPNNKVISCLGKYVPYWDRTIELVILTHPEEDHYGGLLDVFRAYKVLSFGEYNRESVSHGYKVLKNEVGGMAIDSINLTKGTSLRMGMIYLDILHPDSINPERKVNDNGVVMLLKYNKFKAIFMADVENNVSDKLSKLTEIGTVDYIKVNHHGSANGISASLLDTFEPKVAVISVGKDNRYGHPSNEVIKLLNDRKIKIFRTDEIGDIVKEF